MKQKVVFKRSTGGDEQKHADDNKRTDMSEGMTNKLAVAKENIAKYDDAAHVEEKFAPAPGQPPGSGHVTGSQKSFQPEHALERLPLQTFDGTQNI